MADQQTLPDLRRVGVLGLDLETRDNRLAAKKGSGWPFAEGYICGASVAYREGGELRAHYFPIRHPDSANIDAAQLYGWLRDLFASDVRIVTQNGLYDYGWLRAEADLKMPPAERMEEIGALATIVDENRYAYSLEALCDWRGLPGKDLAVLKEAAAALGLPKRTKLQAHIWQFPAHLVAPYAEADAANTLALWESLEPVLDREGTRAAYRLEVDLLPMVLEMRRRGIRIDVGAAEQARDHLLAKRDALFAEISAKLGANVGMAEIGRSKWLAKTFDQHGITYPRTAKGNPSFTAGNTGWMPKHPHWLPPLIVKADRYNNAAANFLQKYILDHVVNGRVHAEVHPHRSDAGGTRSLRFSYSDPPLQLMPAHDEELAPLIRGVFLPEEGEVWAKPDLSQQEFRFIVHYAARHKLTGAPHAVERYRDDPDTDFHKFVSEMTGLERQPAKNTNFAKAFGAGVRKFAAMIGKPESEARVIYETYDRALPFVKQLSQRCQNAATRTGHLTLYDGARRHWDDWEMLGVAWGKGTGPCPREEAERRIKDPKHPWYGRRALRRASTHKAMNALIQGSAARHTKLWMRACWREGIVPMLQMHDSLDCSVSSPEQAARVAELGCAVVQLEVPMRVDVKFGRSWGDAKHTWDELHGAPKTAAATKSIEEIRSLEGEDADAPRDCPAERAPEAATTQTKDDADAKDEAKRDLENPRRRINTRVPHGNGAHPQMCGENHPRVAVAGGIPEPPDNGIDRAAESLDECLARIPLPDLVGDSGLVNCPLHDDNTPSCYIYGDHYHCFGCGAHGNHLDWLRNAEGLSDDAAIEVLFAWQGPSAAPRREAGAERKREFALQLWKEAKPIFGTPAIDYLGKVRGIDVDALPTDNAALRFHPNCPFGRGMYVPCLLALFRDVITDEPVGIHRIGLTPNIFRDAKAKVQRRMLGPWAGPRAIKLWPATDRLFIGEGIETTLAAATRLSHHGAPMRPAWAAGSADWLGKIPFMPGVALTLLVDHDLDGHSAACADECRQRWRDAGYWATRLMPSQPGTDFNDLILEKLRAAA